MTKKAVVQQGFFWHVHHKILLEWCYNYEERAQFIRTTKSPNEQETRLRLFKPVQGRLPEAVVKAGQAYDKALKDNMAEIEVLHANESPNCPWNGHTIFPNS